MRHADGLLVQQEKVDDWVVCWCLQVWQLRRRVPRRVSAESSAVPSLRSARTPPHEAVVFLVTRWRQPWVLLPALPRHLRRTKAVTLRALPGHHAGQSACFSDLCVTPGQILWQRMSSDASSGLCWRVCNLLTHTWAKPLSYCKEQGKKQLLHQALQTEILVSVL